MSKTLAIKPLTLYGMGSPNVRKVLIMLEELDLPYDVRHVAPMRCEQFEPEFLKLNPLGKLPVLLDPNEPDNGGSLFESGAILIYLAEYYHSNLLPKRDGDRNNVIRWLMVQMALVGPMLGQNNHFMTLPAGSGGYGSLRYAEQAKRVYRALDERLAASPWLGGGEYSIADIATWPWTAYLKFHGFAWDDHPHLGAWSNRIRVRAAVKRADVKYRELQMLDKDAVAEATPQQLDRFYGRSSL